MFVLLCGIRKCWTGLGEHLSYFIIPITFHFVTTREEVSNAAHGTRSQSDTTEEVPVVGESFPTSETTNIHQNVDLEEEFVDAAIQ